MNGGAKLRMQFNKESADLCLFYRGGHAMMCRAFSCLVVNESRDFSFHIWAWIHCFFLVSDVLSMHRAGSFVFLGGFIDYFGCVFVKNSVICWYAYLHLFSHSS